MLLQTVLAVVLYQPPLAVLIQQCATMWLTENSAGYCACPLLAGRLAAARLERVSLGLDSLVIFSIPLSLSAPVGLGRQGEQLDGGSWHRGRTERHLLGACAGRLVHCRAML